MVATEARDGKDNASAATARSDPCASGLCTTHSCGSQATTRYHTPRTVCCRGKPHRGAGQSQHDVSRVAAVASATKKKSLHDSQRDTPRVRRLRRRFAKRITEEWVQVLRRLKFIDESGVNFGLTRLFGRALPGQRVVEATPGDSGSHYTLLAALGLQGLQAPWILKGAMDGTAFEVYIEQALLPTLRHGDLVLMDNLSFHKGPHIRQLIASVGAQLEFLPPYSPDLNPIELCWSKVKTALRSAKAHTFEALLEALADAFGSVAKQDIKAWFAHCGYVKP